MKNKFVIIDDFLNKNLILEVLEELKDNNVPETWYNNKENHQYSNFCNIILDECSNYYNLSKSTGYEFWTQNNTKPADWHIDKDEHCFNTTGIYKLPICTIVTYLKVSDLLGGALRLEDCIITPKTNRVVIFPPGIWHTVEEFSGQRVSTLINPWISKPEGYN